MAGKLHYARGHLDKWLYRRGLRSARGLDLPDFLGIGAQKAGTTWLHANLAAHPGVFLPATKELHYFDWNWYRPLRDYAREFAAAGDRLKGEITPSYAGLPEERVAFIRKVMPELRLILFLRDPIDRAWSQAVMNLVKQTGRTPEEVGDDEFIAHFRSARTIERGAYLDNIDRWTRHFGAERLFIGWFEDVSARPRELLEEVFAFLGLDQAVDWSSFPYAQVIHRGAGLALPERLEAVLIEQYAADLEGLAARFGERAARWRRS